MKKQGIIVLLFLIIVIGGVFFFVKKTQDLKEAEEEKIASIKKGWYIEVIYDAVNVRSQTTQDSDIITKIKNGDIYPVLDFYDLDGPYFWYKIKLADNTEGYVANSKNKASAVLIDHNSPNDLYPPHLSFEDPVYYVRTIDEINYRHLTLWDDKEGYKVTHKVYHEYVDCTYATTTCEPKDQYWIRYTITDVSGKSFAKTQQIVFDVRPPEDKVLDFATEYKK